MVGTKRQATVKVDILETNTRKEEIRKFFTLRHEKLEKPQLAFGAINNSKNAESLLGPSLKEFQPRKIV